MKNKFSLLMIFLVLFGSSVFSQTASLLPFVTASPGEQVTLPLTVTGFTNIGSIQFNIQIDPTILAFQIVTGGPSGMLANVSGTTLTILWNNYPPQTFPDGTLCNLVFIYTGPGTSQLTFLGTSAVYQTFGTPPNVVNVELFPVYTNGQVSAYMGNTSTATLMNQACAVTGSTVSVPINYQGFVNNVGSITQKIHYDITKMNYVGMTIIGTSLSGAYASFSGGIVTIAWDNPYGANINYPANQFILNFTYIGTTGTTVEFYPGCIITTNTTFNIPVSYFNGTVSMNPIPTPTITPPGPITFCAGGSVVLTSSAATSYLWSTGATTQAITVTTGGSYTVTVTIGTCSATSTPTTVTVTPNNTITLTSAVGTNAQTICINTAITNITYSTTGATGATFAGLPTGVTGAWASNVVTISGTPTVSGTFTCTVTLTGGCGAGTATVTITVKPNNTITWTSGSTTQTVCINNPITNIIYSTTGATGATFAGLPTGVIGGLASNTVTISGTPTVSGTFSYTITLTGGCGTATATGTITVTPNNTITLTSAAGTNNQTKCINTPITNITYSTTGATGATFTGLPTGVIGGLASNTVTISGTPTVSGPFSYTITLTGGCGAGTATGTITVTPNNTITLTSAVGTTAQTVCINTAITNITYSTISATGATFTGLPTGVTGAWASNVVTINGTPTIAGTFSYTITLTGGCGAGTATGTITVNPNNTTITWTSGSTAQTVCINTPITNITYSTTGATGATFSGLPTGVIGGLASNTVTISGTPTVSGPFSYTVTLTGGCGAGTATGTITVTPNNTITLTSAGGTIAQTVCINTAITNITYSTTGATGATFTGLPTGVTGAWASNIVTISGTPTVSGTFTYTVTLTGGCGTITATGTITVNPNNTITLTSAGGTTAQTVCINTAITNITYSTTRATGATFIGLPAGVLGSWASNVVTISGTPTVSGTFSYTITLTGGCGAGTATGTITVTPNNTITLTSAGGTIAQTVCMNNPITNITYSTTGATGATLTGLPTGVTGAWASSVVTISGTPTVSGTFSYTVTLTGGCGTITASGTITVNPNNTITLTSGVGTDVQTVCINTAITNITYSTTGATGAIVTGLPAGVSGSWASNVVTINGTPTVSGTFNYTITLTVGCGAGTATGTIMVTPNNTITLTSAGGTDAQTVCINTAITNITYSTTGAAGATFTGLPTGVTGALASNVVTISGTPTVSGTFNYTVTLTGGCGTIIATGTITVTQNNTITLTSAGGTNAQTICINTAITNITYSTTGATGATFSGLPTGVLGSWAANVVTISGTPTVSGTFNYTVTLTGGCGTITAAGTITVNPINTITLTSAAGTNNQTKCINTAITNITYSTTGATGATFIGLPAGVIGSWAANVVTISGTPTVSGTFNYTVTLTGGCGTITATGTITVNPNNTITLTSAGGTIAQTLCINTAITNITYSTIGATGATVTGLPAGVTGTWAANVVTISGTPTVSGTFNYTVTLTGGCGTITATGSITVTPNNTITWNPGSGSTTQTACIYTAITSITYTTTGATGGTVTGLPAGVTGSWAGNVVTISGTPTVSGTFNYTVTLTGGCGTITANGTITVNPVPNPAGTITGTAYVCAGTNGVAYSVAPIANAVTYIWTLPPYAYIVTGIGTNAITVNFPANALSGNIFVYGNNLCGNGTSSPPFAVTVGPLPDPAGTITGPAAVCEGTSNVVYSVPTIANATSYNWTVPTGVIIVSGGTTNSITVDFTPSAVSGNITVFGINSCGNGTVSPNFAVTVNPIPPAPVVTNTGYTAYSSAPAGNQWYYSATQSGTGAPIPGATAQTYYAVPTGTGWYWSIVTLNGCSSDTSNHKLIITVGIDSHSSTAINIYPVPNDGRFNVSITTASSESFSISVYNNLGVKIYEETKVDVNGSLQKVIDLRPVPSGVYSVIFVNSENQVVKKIIVNK
jgi:hypothetical protein